MVLEEKVRERGIGNRVVGGYWGIMGGVFVGVFGLVVMQYVMQAMFMQNFHDHTQESLLFLYKANSLTLAFSRIINIQLRPDNYTTLEYEISRASIELDKVSTAIKN